METEMRKLFLLMNKKSVYRIRKKDRFAKFSGISPTEKMALQNFPAFLQLKNAFAKFSGVSPARKCPTITHFYIVEVEIALEVSNKTKRNRKSVWQLQFKQNKVVNSFDCINFRQMMLETAPTASIQTKWSGKLRWKVRSKHFEGVKTFYKESCCWVKLMLYCIWGIKLKQISDTAK